MTDDTCAALSGCDMRSREPRLAPKLQDPARSLFSCGPLGPKGLIVNEKSYAGRTGNRNHITMTQDAWVPIATLLTLEGVMGEVRAFDAAGNFGNYSKARWEAYLADLEENGLMHPVFLTEDYGEKPKISEGNHRIQALKQLGYLYCPAEIRYFGNAQERIAFGPNGQFNRIGA